MALAHIEILDYVNNAIQCKIDIGKNKYYQILIGDSDNLVGGLPVIENNITSTNILGPLSADELGRKNISIPQNIFDKQNNKLKLLSYYDKDKKGIAVSDVLSVIVNQSAKNKEPELSFSKNNIMNSENYGNTVNSYHTSFSIKENKMSNSMFWASLIPMIGGAVKSLLPGIGGAVKNILPNLLNNAPNIIGSVIGGAVKPQTGSTPVTGVSNPPASGNALMQLLNSPEITALLQNLLQQTLNSSSAKSVTSRANSLQRRINGKYSEAKIAPALLAALPGLMPLLQQILSPETIGKVLDHPQKMIGAVTDSIAKLGELGIASHEQDLQHLRAIHPDIGPPVDGLLESFSMAITENQKLIPYKLLKTVKIKFASVTTVNCEGKDCLIYNYGGKIIFPVQIESPKPIGNCILQLCVKDVKTSKLLLIKNFKYKTSADIAGSYPVLEEMDYKNLNSNNDYLVGVSIIFKNKTKENIGVYCSEVIHFTNSHYFSSVKGKGEPIPLNDIQVHRAFWHRLWQTKFSKEVMRTKIHFKYYCMLTNDKDGVGKMETLTKPVKTEDKYERSMLLKSGIKINIGDLNKLIPIISKQNVLEENQLNAINSPDFLSSYNTVAQDIIKMNGFENEIAMLWVFPELSMHELILKKINKTNEYGMVVELTDEIVQFPLPTSLYFIGTKNK